MTVSIRYLELLTGWKLVASSFILIHAFLPSFGFRGNRQLPSVSHHGPATRPDCDLLQPRMMFSNLHGRHSSSNAIRFSSTDLVVDSGVNELKLFQKNQRRKDFQSTQGNDDLRRRTKSATHGSISINEIISKPIGSLSAQFLKSLCNSIRQVRAGSSSQSLNTLHRILLELEHWQENNEKLIIQTGHNSLLKPIHVFSVLTAISKDVRHQKREGKSKFESFSDVGRRPSMIMEAGGVKQLKSTVLLLRQLVHEFKGNSYCDPRCYNEDVPSFAAMITADASQWESTAPDAAMFFFRLIKVRTNGGDDPRLVGALLNSLAYWGRAEEAQELLEDVLGVEMTNNGPQVIASKTRFVTNTTASKRRPYLSQFGSCYEALLRAWSKRVILLAQVSNDEPRPQEVIDQIDTALSRAESILFQHIMPNQLGFNITRRAFTAVLQGYQAIGKGAEAEDLLLRIEALIYSPHRPNLQRQSSSHVSNLDAACYNAVLDAYCHSRQLDAIHRAEILFEAMTNGQSINITTQQSSDTMVEMVPPRADTITWNTMINCYCKNDMIDQAERLLTLITTANCRHASSPLKDPNKQISACACGLSVIKALENSNDRNASERVLSWIAVMERCEECELDRSIYTSALRCMSKHGRGAEAEILMKKLQHAYPLLDHTHNILCVLKAWERSNPLHYTAAAIRVEKLFYDWQDEVKQGLLPPIGLDVYNCILNCFAKAGFVDKAEVMIAMLERGSREGTTSRPNAVSYSRVIKALSYSNQTDAVDRAWEMLYRQGYQPQSIDISKANSTMFNVTPQLLNSMLKLLAKRGKALDAENLLHYMDELVVEGKLQNGPDVSSYDAVLEALGRCNDCDSVIRAEALITRMEVCEELGGSMAPTLLTYNHLLNCYGNAGMAGKAEHLLHRLKSEAVSFQPDEYSFGSTIKAIVNSGKNQDNALARVDTLANELKQSSGSNNDVIFALRLKLYAKFGMGFEAEQLLKEMNTPGIIHYTAALNAWAKSKEEYGSERAEALYREIEEHPDLDLAAYHGLLLNYSLRGQVKKAEELVNKIVRVRPDINRNTFTMLVDAHIRSQSPNASERAEQILDKMRELHAAGYKEVEPDNVAYANIIRCIMNGSVANVTHYEKTKLMRRLQIEKWPSDIHPIV